MHLIKSDLLSTKILKKKTHILDNKYSEIQNFLDLLDINNNLYNFICNPFLNYNKKCFFLYIIYHIENYSSIILKLIQFTTSKKKSDITYAFMSIWNKKKKWVQINVITAIPLSSSIEEDLIKLFKKINKNIKYFLEKKVKNNIIGGLSLCIEDKEWDSSLEEKIRKLRIYLNNYI